MSTLSKFQQWWINALPHRIHIKRYIPKLLRRSPEPFRGEVLEVGAGRGWTSRQVLETFPQVELTASDINPNISRTFARLQQHYGSRLRFKQADLLNLPFDRSSFDIVIGAHVMHHIKAPDQAIRQMLRVLRPGGLLGLTNQNQYYIVGPLKLLWRPTTLISRPDLEAIIKREGAEIVISEGDAHFIIWARKPYPVKPDTKKITSTV